MDFNHDIKSQLAKLLATENLIVESKQVQTASFNVHTRVLTLPQWDQATGSVYDLLVAHEVGHALFTPDEKWDEAVKVPHQFVNVVEDVRIEKLIKRKYLGLGKTFFQGYRELNEQDFFQIGEEDIESFNLADRVNLHAKIGHFVDVPFTDVERGILKIVEDCETFEDTLAASVILYEYCKREKEVSSKISDIDEHQQGNNSGDSEETENSDSQEDGGDVDEGDSEEKSSGEDKPEGDLQSKTPGQTADPNVRTLDSFDESIRDLNAPQYDRNELNYVEIPDVNLDTIIAKNSEVHEVIDGFYSQYGQVCFYDVDKSFSEFKKSAQKEVNYLVKEFECRKAADAYARASTSRTGVLDTQRLHSYKYSEDIFKRITTVADGKNHGLVFILDWSGSMSHVIDDTCKQLFNLVWFCKKVNIPFDVYAFTNEWRRHQWHLTAPEGEKFNDMPPHAKKKEGNLVVEGCFSLMNILTSKVSGKVFENQIRNIYRLANSFSCRYSCGYSYPAQLSLSGTPLNESLVALHKILPKFQKENRLQKVHTIILTDGEAGPLNSYRWMDYPEGDGYYGQRRSGGNTILRDRKLGTTYKFDWSHHGFTGPLIQNLRDKFPSVSFIGIRVLAPRDFQYFARNYTQSCVETCEVTTQWKKEKSCTFKNTAYHAYFALSSAALSQDSEFEVDEDANKTQIKRAFMKSLKTKKLNKRVLGEFISLVV